MSSLGCKQNHPCFTAHTVVLLFGELHQGRSNPRDGTSVGSDHSLKTTEMWSKSWNIMEMCDGSPSDTTNGAGFGVYSYMNHSTYCWWKKSYSSWYGKYIHISLFTRVLYIRGGAGFLPSTVSEPCWVPLINPFLVSCSATLLEEFRITSGHLARQK